MQIKIFSFRVSLQSHVYSFIRFVSCLSHLLLALIACHKINTQTHMLILAQWVMWL